MWHRPKDEQTEQAAQPSPRPTHTQRPPRPTGTPDSEGRRNPLKAGAESTGDSFGERPQPHTPHKNELWRDDRSEQRDAKIQLLKENGSKYQSRMKQAKFLKQYRGGTCVAQLVRVCLLLRSRSGGPVIEPWAGLPAPWGVSFSLSLFPLQILPQLVLPLIRSHSQINSILKKNPNSYKSKEDDNPTDGRHQITPMACVCMVGLGHGREP